jgi:hypothetical protein
MRRPTRAVYKVYSISVVYSLLYRAENAPERSRQKVSEWTGVRQGTSNFLDLLARFPLARSDRAWSRALVRTW